MRSLLMSKSVCYLSVFSGGKGLRLYIGTTTVDCGAHTFLIVDVDLGCVVGVFRVEVGRCGSSHPVRRGLDVCDSGELETPQHSAALQGETRDASGGQEELRHQSCLNMDLYFDAHQVPDGATVALVPRHTKNLHHDNHDYIAGESKLRTRRHLKMKRINYSVNHMDILFVQRLRCSRTQMKAAYGSGIW